MNLKIFFLLCAWGEVRVGGGQGLVLVSQILEGPSIFEQKAYFAALCFRGLQDRHAFCTAPNGNFAVFRII